MTAARFKSKDDYFSKRSDLARRVIESEPQKHPKKGVFTSVPVSLVNDLFCRTTDSFEIEGRGHFTAGEYSLDEALLKHLSGDETVKVNPLSHNGETVWNVVRFVLSDTMDHPFTKAKQFADELQSHDIRSLIEVTEGGKGDYHLWIFHEEPVDGQALADALVRLGRKLFGQLLETAPSRDKEVYIPLPLQGDSLLFQHRVFVNGVGKMIKDQSSVLKTAPLNPPHVIEAFISSIAAGKPDMALPDESRIPPEAKKHDMMTEKAHIDEKIALLPSLKAAQKPEVVQKAEVRPVKPIPKEATAVPSRIRVLVCKVMKTEYGIDADSVLRVMMPDDMTAVPGAAPVIGTVCDNGRTIPVLDAGHILEEKKSEFSPRSRILIIQGNHGYAALLVDGANGIIHASAVRENTRPNTVVSYSAEIDGPGGTVPCIDPELLVSFIGSSTGTKELSAGRPDARFVVFSVNGLRCGFSTEIVREIVVPEAVQTRSKTDADQQRVMQYGKTYIPIIDVCKHLNGPPPGSAGGLANGTGTRRRVIIVKAINRFVGAAVDSIESVRTITADTVDPAPAALMDRTPIVGFVRGTGTLSPAFVILDPDRMV